MVVDVDQKERELRNELARNASVLAVHALEPGDRAYHIGVTAARLQAAYDAWREHVTGETGETGTETASACYCERQSRQEPSSDVL